MVQHGKAPQDDSRSCLAIVERRPSRGRPQSRAWLLTFNDPQQLPVHRSAPKSLRRASMSTSGSPTSCIVGTGTTSLVGRAAADDKWKAGVPLARRYPQAKGPEAESLYAPLGQTGYLAIRSQRHTNMRSIEPYRRGRR